MLLTIVLMVTLLTEVSIASKDTVQYLEVNNASNLRILLANNTTFEKGKNRGLYCKNDYV
jgi:hypothetical protein